MLVLLCESCQIRVPAYDAWVQHVLSDQHQSSSIIKRVMQSKNIEEIHTKGLLAVISDGPPLSASIVAWHVSNFGLLCDLYYGSNQKCVIFHLDSKDCNEAALAGTNEIENIPVVVQWVSSVPVAEWERVFGIVRRTHPSKTFESKIFLPHQYYGFLETIFHQESLSQEERVRRHVAINDVANIIQAEYQQATFHPYGSYVTSLGNADSSLNIFVGNLQIVVPNTNGESSGRKNAVVTRITLEDICHYLQTLPNPKKSMCNGVTIMCAPDNQKFIQFMHRPTNLWGNIYVRNPLPVQRSKLIAFYMTLDDRVRPFLQLIRYWGRFHGLTSGMPGIKKPTVMRNYALMLLAIVFLENVQIIPTVQALQLLQKDERDPCPVGPWEGSFCENKEQVLAYMEMTRDTNAAPKNEDPNESVTNKVINLAHEFFNRLALLEPNSLIVCTLLGKFKPKYQFYGDALHELPEGLERYKIALESRAFKPLCHPPIKNRNDKQFLSMVVQDPFELTVNVTEHLSSDFLIKFRIICSTTALAFQKLITVPGRQNNLETAVKDLFTPVPAVEINNFRLKSVIGELMVKRREINQKQPRQERSNGFSVDEKSPNFQKSLPNPSFDSYYDVKPTMPKSTTPKPTMPKPLMSIKPYPQENIPGNFAASGNDSTSYPLPLLNADYMRRAETQPSDFDRNKNFPTMVPAPVVTQAQLPPPPPPAPIIMDSKDSVVKISVDSLYESIFNEAFYHLKRVQEEGYLESKRNTLWLLCFSELILSVWHKCFKLNDVLIKENELDVFVKHTFPNDVFHLMDLSSTATEGEPEGKKRRKGQLEDVEDGEINEVDYDKLWTKINKIPDYPNVFATTFECFVNKPFFNARQEIARWMANKDDRNPLDREEEITKKVLIRCLASDLSTNITIQCSVSADMTKADDQIQLSFHESFEKSKMSVEDTFFQRFFSLLVPEYAIFRLCQLLDIPNRWQSVNFNK